MNRILTFAGVVLVVVALAACSPGIHTLGNSVTMDSTGVVVHVAGHPDAHVGRDGSLSIDGKIIAVTPDQRKLLQRYVQETSAAVEAGAKVGKQGISIAAHGIGAAFASIFHDGPSPQEKKLDAESDQIEAAASKLCGHLKALGATQAELATEIPAFAPYASGDRPECKITHTTTYRIDGNKSTSVTYTSGDGTAASGKPAPSRHAASPGSPAASDESQQP
jgi:hypothetical protein